MEDAWNQHDLERAVDLEVRIWVDGPGQPVGRAPASVRERVREMDLRAARYPLTGQAARLDPPAAGRLQEIRAPTLIIVGDLDATGVKAACDLLAREVPGARKVEIAGTAHMVNMEAPDEFSRAVLAFLETV